MSGKPTASPFWEFIGIKEHIAENGYAEVHLDIKPELLQRRGNVHGGVIASLVDASIGSAVRSTTGGDAGPATIELKLNYLRPAQGKHLVAKASLYHRGSTTAVGKSEVYDDKGQLIAVGTATFMMLKLPAVTRGENA